MWRAIAPLCLFVFLLDGRVLSEDSAHSAAPPLLTNVDQLLFADPFTDGANERWFFNKSWTVAEGVLRRVTDDARTTRLFLKETEFSDAVIQFAFRLGKSRDVRLVTGANGPYNAVIHIRSDHFYIQTAKDPSGPYFSYRHGECAFDFRPDRWYVMTVEFLGDELVAQLDSEHLAYAKHPILSKTRTYFAFQADQQSAEFDNVRISSAVRCKEYDQGLQHIRLRSGGHPVEKTVEEQFAIQKSNAHEWFFQRSEQYVELVAIVDELDAEQAERFPQAFRSHKAIHKEVATERKRLLKEDSQYKERLFATYRAKREMEAFLVSQQPQVADLPQSQKPREIELLRQRFRAHPEYLALMKIRDAAQQQLEDSYPHLFVTDEEINAKRRARREALKENKLFEELTQRRAAAWRDQQDFLFRNDKHLAGLREAMDQRAGEK